MFKPVPRDEEVRNMNAVVRRFKWPYLTSGFMIICAVLFARTMTWTWLQSHRPGFDVGLYWYVFTNQPVSDDILIYWGALVPSLVWKGELWRLITPMFLHLHAFHIAANLASLYLIGRQLEAIYGKWRYIAIMVVGNCFGTVSSVVLWPDQNSVGASAAISALIGALIYLRFRYAEHYPKMRLPFWLMVVLVIGGQTVLDIFVLNANYVAHLSSLGGGFLLAVLLQPGLMKWHAKVAAETST